MEPGSIQDVTERLKSWCARRDAGFARIEWDSALARGEVIARLRESLNGAGIPVIEIELPAGESAERTVAYLIERLRSASGSVVSITGIEWAFPERGSRLDTLAAISFQRETLAALPVRQIWWVPSSLTEKFVLSVPDLDSWFQLRLHLTEVPVRLPEARRALEGVQRRVVSVAEARSLERRFWDRLESARQQQIPEDRIWTELAEPAVDALLSAGRGNNADAILATMRFTPGDLERELRELSAGRGLGDLEVLSVAERVARLLGGQGDFAGAQRLQKPVLEARERILGEENPATLVSMRDLAETLRARGDFVSARKLGERVLDITTRLLGEEHPSTLAAMNNLAETLRARGDIAVARKVLERVLDVTTRVLGEEHPGTLASMSNLASALRAQGDYEGARRLYQRALDGLSRALGESHPDTLTAMNNLAETLRAQGDLDGARRLQERVLEVMRHALGEEHPDTLTAMNNLAITLGAQGDRAGARPLQDRVLATSKRVLGEEHPGTLGAMNNLASTLRVLDDLDGAQALQERLLEITRRVLGDKHPNTLTAMNNLGGLLFAAGDWEHGLHLVRECLRGRREVLGENHPDTVATAEFLARLEMQARAGQPSG